MTPYADPRSEELRAVCSLCRERATANGWKLAGAAIRHRSNTRMRVENVNPEDSSRTTLGLVPSPELGPEVEPASEPEPDFTPPQAAILERAIGLEAISVDDHAPTELLARIRAQDHELEQLRRDINPARHAEERRNFERQAAELRELRSMLQERDARIDRLQRARHAETSPMRMSGFALDAINQSRELERMARIARTLGDPIVNVHDEGPGIPRRVRVTMSWDIAWYEFVVKLDLGAGAASVHETGTGGDPSVLPIERRRANAQWSDSGITLA
ncbi:MAG: hypothetical protein ABI200_06980 [Gaiellales bacterium]